MELQLAERLPLKQGLKLLPINGLLTTAINSPKGFH